MEASRLGNIVERSHWLLGLGSEAKGDLGGHLLPTASTDIHVGPNVGFQLLI